MKKLFENINGNQFKLITENTDDVPKSTLVREGLKKVLSSGGKELSYRQLETVGLGYIRNVEEAKKCALKEAREIASEYGYKDNEDSQKFVKEETRLVKEFDKLHADRDPSVCASCGEEYSDNMEPGKNPHNLCSDCWGSAASDAAYDKQDRLDTVDEVSWNDEESYKRSHGDNETDMSDPEEKREVEVLKKILQYSHLLKEYLHGEEGGGKYASANAIELYAKELLKMHGAK